MEHENTDSNTSLINLDAEFTALYAAKRSRSANRSAGPSCGDLCLAPIPFSDGRGAKVRPAVVLCAQGTDLVVAPLTTHAARDQFDVELSRWAESGLSAASTVRCARIGCIARTAVRRVVGRLIPDDIHRVSQAASRWFDTILSETPAP